MTPSEMPPGTVIPRAAIGPAASRWTARLRATGLALLLPLLPMGASAVAGAAEPLGRIDFPTSARSSEAQEHFERGVLWLHSFEYSDAREEFRRAREIEPGFAMASWGEAMTHNHPIWVRVDLEAGRWALERLGATREERLTAASTERERGYLAAVETLFFGDGDKAARDDAYAEAMRRLHRRHPEDHEAAAFYALALLGTRQGERDFATYMQAAAVAEEVYLDNPEHPGALHYLIHSYDEPVHAPLGLRAARRYAEVAAAAPHALHMTSHIFLAMGMWEATESANVDSWEASLARGGRNYHALYWLAYALLQQGRWAEADAAIATLAADVAERGGLPHARAHLAYVAAARLADTPPPEAPLENIEPLPTVDVSELQLDGLGLHARTAAWYARGALAVRAGDATGARRAADRIRRAAEGDEGRDVGAAQATALQLEALATLAEDGDSEADRWDVAIALLRQAAETEDRLPLDLGPPFPAKPSWELLGETLLAAGRPAEARHAFERALELAPGRSRSLAGLAAAAEATGDAARAGEARALLATNRAAEQND